MVVFPYCHRARFPDFLNLSFSFSYPLLYPYTTLTLTTNLSHFYFTPLLSLSTLRSIPLTTRTILRTTFRTRPTNNQTTQDTFQTTVHEWYKPGRPLKDHIPMLQWKSASPWRTIHLLPFLQDLPVERIPWLYLLGTSLPENWLLKEYSYRVSSASSALLSFGPTSLQDGFKIITQSSTRDPPIGLSRHQDASPISP